MPNTPNTRPSHSNPTPIPTRANLTAQTTSAPIGEPIRSQFAEDPEMRELVEMFVGELPQRTQTLMNAFREQQWETIQRISHQLKGASAGYGFPTIGVAAGNVEDVVRAGPITDTGTIAKLTDTVKQLVSLCDRAAA